MLLMKLFLLEDQQNYFSHYDYLGAPWHAAPQFEILLIDSSLDGRRGWILQFFGMV
jgi:hypothetical protein